jgi:transcription antitermination protein NusB
LQPLHQDVNKNDPLPDINPEDIVKREVIEPPVATNERSLSRRVALQVLYELDTTHHQIGDVISGQINQQSLTPKTARYLRQIVQGVVENRKRLDAVIQHFAPEWPLSQVAIIDRNILRMAVYEFTIQQQTPMRVAINEAVELAKLFGADGAARFVNGVLGALSDHPETTEAILNDAAYAPQSSTPDSPADGPAEGDAEGSADDDTPAETDDPNDASE